MDTTHDHGAMTSTTHDHGAMTSTTIHDHGSMTTASGGATAPECCMKHIMMMQVWNNYTPVY